MFFRERGKLNFNTLLMCALVALATGCSSKQDGQGDPKRRLNEYISQGFAVSGTQDRMRLISYLTGEAKTRLESWSDEQFRQAFIDSKRQFLKLAFKEVKNESPDQVGITYELTYQADYKDIDGSRHDAKITNRRLAQMKRENGQWFIGEVRNIREVVEYKNEMEIRATGGKGASQGR